MLLRIIIWVLLAWLAIPVLYFLTFALAARFRRKQIAPVGTRRRRFTILIPAYHSDSCIIDTTRAALDQDYPKELFSVVVISDGMRPETVAALRESGAEVLEVVFEQSSKGKALAAAVDSLGPDAADAVAILDADNLASPSFLSSIDDAMCAGARAIQAHRTAKNEDTPVAVIDAVSEEINNSIFRSGHCALGISSALIGSGMAFEYGWFADNVRKFTTSGEDKEMELQLLRDGIFVEYLEDEKVLDEKTRTRQNYAKQRRRWIASQYNLMSDAIRNFKDVKDKTGYADKLFQWCFPPRMILIGAVPFLALLLTVFGSPFALWWWILTALLVIALLMAMPRGSINGNFFKALLRVPALAFTAVANVFRIKGTKDTFIHTDHK